MPIWPNGQLVGAPGAVNNASQGKGQIMADCENHNFLAAAWLAPLNALAGYDQAAAIAELDDMADRELVDYWHGAHTRSHAVSLSL